MLVSVSFERHLTEGIQRCVQQELCHPRFSFFIFTCQRTNTLHGKPCRYCRPLDCRFTSNLLSKSGFRPRRTPCGADLFMMFQERSSSSLATLPLSLCGYIDSTNPNCQRTFSKKPSFFDSFLQQNPSCTKAAIFDKKAPFLTLLKCRKNHL